MKQIGKIGQYEIVETLYARPDYACYLCIDKSDNHCVIKAFDLSIIEDAADELKAARKLASISHPNLVRVYKVDRDAKSKIYYYVMERWGEDLRNTIKYKPDPKVALEIIKQVLAGLAELHKNKLVHRDIKPENIFIKQGQAKIGDYGLVKSQRWQTRLMTYAGTTDYMAPEIIDGKAYDKRVDIYSTGIVLRELLTGERPPFKNNAKPFGIADSIWQVTMKAVVNEPAERFQQVDEFSKALEKAQSTAKRPKRLAQAARMELNEVNKIPFPPNTTEILDEAVKKILTMPQREKALIRAKHFSEQLNKESLKMQPIFQKLEISRYPPKPVLYGEQDKPGQFIQTFQAQFDNLAKGTDYEAMLKVARPLEKEVERRFGKDNSRTADAYDRLAWVFLKMNNYREASNWYFESSKIDLKLYGEQSREYLGSLYRLAETRLAASDYPAAQEYYERMTVIMAKLPTKGHPEDAVIRNNLGAIKHLTKSYPNAITHYQEAMDINEKHSKADGMAINLYNMGLAYEAMGNKPAAEPLFKRAAYFANNAFKPGDPLLERITLSLK